MVGIIISQDTSEIVQFMNEPFNLLGTSSK